MEILADKFYAVPLILNLIFNMYLMAKSKSLSENPLRTFFCWLDGWWFGISIFLFLMIELSIKAPY